VEERLLGVDTVSTFPRIQEIVEAKEPYDKLWRSVVKFTVKQDDWLNGCLVDLNAEEIEEEVRIILCRSENITIRNNSNIYENITHV
jgi:dynein heavy chain